MARKPAPGAIDAVFENLLDSEAVAKIIGTVSPATVRSYSVRGIMPKPARYVGRTPLWDRAEVLAWIPTRPGQGVGGGRPRKLPRTDAEKEKMIRDDLKGRR
ncbi:MAG: hypothetical protein NVS3B1_06250 [Marmoricola sp.]